MTTRFFALPKERLARLVGFNVQSERFEGGQVLIGGYKLEPMHDGLSNLWTKKEEVAFVFFDYPFPETVLITAIGTVMKGTIGTRVDMGWNTDQGKRWFDRKFEKVKGYEY